MSTRKRKIAQDFETLEELVLKTKSQLGTNTFAHRPELVSELERIAALAEALSSPMHGDLLASEQADFLDQEGVNLWNNSMMISTDEGNKESASLLSAIRLAAFRLVVAGVSPKPQVDGLLYIIRMASKTGSSLTDLERYNTATSVLTQAAKFEEMLRNAPETADTNPQLKASATFVYYSARMEAAWKEGNMTLAEYMAQKITEDDVKLQLLSLQDRMRLAAKIHDVGRSILTRIHDSQGQSAVEWLQRAYGILEHTDTGEDDVQGTKLKVAILRTLARAYVLAGADDQAEATLSELLPVIDGSDINSPEHQEIRVLRLAILRRRNASDAEMQEAFQGIIEHMQFTQQGISDLLQDLRSLGKHHVLVTDVHRKALSQALATASSIPHESLDRLLLSWVVHATKDDDHGRALKDLKNAFSLCQREHGTWRLSKVSVLACLTVLWRCGDKCYMGRQYSEASEWYLAATHPLFFSDAVQSSSPDQAAKCYRKAALCYLERKEFASATNVIRKCTTNEAANVYVQFLCALQQGSEEDAIQALEQMKRAPDFDRKLLLLATQASHQAGQKPVLLAVLQELLKLVKASVQESENVSVLESLTLVRCVIRLCAKLLEEKEANKPVLVSSIVAHFQTAKGFVDLAVQKDVVTVIRKDLSWLWRTAYNTAVQGCTDWGEEFEAYATALFRVARDFLKVSFVDVKGGLSGSQDIQTHLIYATFGFISGRVFAARRIKNKDAYSDIITDIQDAISQIDDLTDDAPDENNKVKYLAHTLRVFYAESLAKTKNWKELENIVQNVSEAGPLASDTYEAILDIIWADPDCPVDVLYHALDALLKAGILNSQLSVDKFSRWIRAICNILLSKSHRDRAKAIGYVENALTVIEEHHVGQSSEDTYPLDERHWLLATSYNTGFECFESYELEEAKRWFEAATVICRFVPGGKDRAVKISETYSRLLERYKRSSPA